MVEKVSGLLARARDERQRSMTLPLVQAALEVASDVVEGVVELVADALHRADRRNGDEGGNQAIFDGSRALLVPKQLCELGHVKISHSRASGAASENLSKHG
jgi:hypothetical protein